ncbi:hypothetical protein EZV62_016678 [Acer yangbiense]|uniref:CCHC-type domain-containing protein n=1 Tax=Acer yangbiense TaxID=1000413 RepID=A0A5C7HPU6_9ROSI|nr:hypothetical protein EZV62_016678 [Acer yangbiense]
MSKAMKKPADVENCMRVEVFEPLVEEFFKKSHPKDPLQACIRESATKEDEDSEVAEHALYLDTFPLANFRKRWHFEELGEGKPKLPPSIEKPPVLELKQLPSNLRNPQVDSSMPRASRKQKGKGVSASGSSNGVRHSNYRGRLELHVVFVVAGNKCGGVESACLGKVLAKERLELGHKIEENERAELLLQSLPDSYDQLIINLTNNILVEYLVFDDVAAAVLEEESRRKNKEDRSKSSQQAEALTMTRGRSTERGPSRSHNHGRSKSRSRKNVKCYSCGKKGHVKSECWHNKKKSGDNRALESSSSQGCVASTSDDGEVLYSEGNTVAEGRKRFADVWLLDSAATWHMTSRREWFHKYEPVSGGSVFMGNDHALEIAGIGTIKIKMHDGTIRSIQEVRHVKGLKKNLLSLGQLDDLGCKTQIENGILKIVRGALVVMKAEKITSNLYMLKGETLQEADSCVASNNHGEESTIIWHRKLGHISERGLKILSDQNLLPGLKSVNLPFCEHCVTSKQHRLKFSSSTARSKCILDLIHSDGYRIWDPTAHKVVISRDVIFVEDQLQKEEDNITLKENSETTDVQVENNLEQEDSISYEAEPEHETQVTDEPEALEVRRSTRERRPPVWHSESSYGLAET